MIVCKKCGAANDDGSTVCSCCSAALRVVNPFANSEAMYSRENRENTEMPMGQSLDSNNTASPADVYHTAYGGRRETLRDDAPITAGQWFMIIGVNVIPVIGNLVFIAIMLIFAFGGTQKKTMVNFARAFFIFFAICAVLCIIGNALGGSGGDSSYTSVLASISGR